MRKTILMAFAALAFAAGNAYAQSMTGTIAPKPGYTCDFENAEKADFNEKEIVINGKRWLFRNARITDSAIHGIPQGNRAAELLAGSVDGKQACIELLDTVHGAGISFCFSHSGMDRTIERSNEAWFIDVTADDGNTWATMPLTFDTNDFPGMLNFAPPFEGAPFRFRIRYTDKYGHGEGWRVLIDNIYIVAGERGDNTWYIQPGRIPNGYETSQDSITFTPVMSGSSFFFGPPDYDYADTYVQMQVDNRTPEKFYTMPMDMTMTVRDLAEGEHNMSIKFMRHDDDMPWDGPLETNVKFNVRPVSGTIMGVKALRNAEVGKFYDLVPDGSDTIYVNWPLKTRAQKWLFDDKAGILVDDPNYLGYQGEFPETDMAVKKMRGQLLMMDNNLVFRLDAKPEIEAVGDSKFHFRNYICDDLSLLTSNYERYAGFPLSLKGVSLTKSFQEIDKQPNARIEIKDKDGNCFLLQNIYPEYFQASQFVTGGQTFIIYGMLGKAFIDGKPCFFPLKVTDDDTPPASIDNTNADNSQLSARHEGGTLMLSAGRNCEVVISDIAGRTVARLSLAAGTPAALPFARGLFVATAKYEDGTTSSVKFVN